MTLADLIARVEGLTGPDREVDGEVALLVGWTHQKMKGDAYPYWRQPGVTEYYRRWELPRYTASIDAVVALIERELPGCGHGYLPRFYKEKPFAGVIGADGASIDLLTATIVGGETPALALLAAFLRALDAIAQRNGGKT